MTHIAVALLKSLKKNWLELQNEPLTLAYK